MNKRTILSLPDEILKIADERAIELHVSRAEYIRRAIAGYAEELKRKKEEEEIHKQREEACQAIDRLREKFGKIKDPDWNPVKIIREWRDKDRLTQMYERQEADVMVVREGRKKP